MQQPNPIARYQSDGKAEARLHFRIVALPSACIHGHSHQPLRESEHYATWRCHGKQQGTGKSLLPRPATFHILICIVCSPKYATVLCMHPPILTTYFVSMVSTGSKAESLSSPSLPGGHLPYFRISASLSTASRYFRISG